MRVIGTAGHVDHGKSTLVKRLTGIDPDRLAEEKARQMTIDLGFAWLTLPNGEPVGVVDVPGHRDFIENMLAGVGGLDAVLLVIAADEGVMPQTREHLAIIDLLNIQHGIIVLSKCDLVDDEWIDLVEQDVRAEVRGTVLQSAEIMRVSAYTGAGTDELLTRLSDLLSQLPFQADTHHPRLPIDRVFTIKGFGTVLTGTLQGGSLRVGDEVELQPGGQRGRIRGLQSHKQQVDSIKPGNRAAVNVSGVEREDAVRGQVLAYPGQLQPSALIDVHFRHLKDAGRPLKHNAEVKFFSGAAESNAHVRLLADDVLAVGAESWLQVRLEKPLALAQGDRFIIRYPSPGQTIGGGVVVNAQPGKRWRRFQPDVIRDLETRLSGSPAERVTQAAAEPMKRHALQERTRYNDPELDAAIAEAVAQGILYALPDASYLAEAQRQDILQRMSRDIAAFHAANPLRAGMSREELRSRYRLKNALFNMLLETQDEIVSQGELVRLAAHQIQFTPAQEAQITQLMPQMHRYTPPSFVEAAQVVGAEVLRALIELGEIVQVQEDVIFSRPVYEEMAAAVLEIIDTQGSINAKTLRDRFDTSRKFAIGLLEYLDAQGDHQTAGG
ncbi:MAG: selenocysteine-specific translation elongation factor [Anaerolineae bacterium]